MKYRALATDFDGTIAHDGRVDDSTVEALRRVRAAGHRLIMVTGRELTSLFNTFEQVDMFDLVVAENGAVLYTPATERSTCSRLRLQVRSSKHSSVNTCRSPSGTVSWPRWSRMNTPY